MNITSLVSGILKLILSSEISDASMYPLPLKSNDAKATRGILCA